MQFMYMENKIIYKVAIYISILVSYISKAYSKVLEHSCSHLMWNITFTDCWF